MKFFERFFENNNKMVVARGSYIDGENVSGGGSGGTAIPVNIIGGDDISVVESPANTFTISFDGSSIEPLEIEDVNSSISISDFDKIYSLQGLSNYTVTLPDASSNENNIVRIFKHATSPNQHTVQITTTGGQLINAYFNEVEELNMRFGGEFISLISDGVKWNVFGESGLFNNQVVVRDENEFLLGISKLNDLLGGELIIDSLVEITEPREVNLDNIIIRSSGSGAKRIRFTEYENHLLINGNYNFQDIRLQGVATNAEQRSHNILRVNIATVNGVFRNVTFQNIIASQPEENGNGVLRYVWDGSVGGSNVTFTDCDYFPQRSDAFEIVLDDNGSGSFGVNFFNVFVSGMKREQTTFRLSSTGPTNNWNGTGDGTALFTGAWDSVNSYLRGSLITDQQEGIIQPNDDILFARGNTLFKTKADFFEKDWDAGNVNLNTTDISYSIIPTKPLEDRSLTTTIVAPTGSEVISHNIENVSDDVFKLNLGTTPSTEGYEFHWHSLPFLIIQDESNLLGDETLELSSTELREIDGFGASAAWTSTDLSDNLIDLFFDKDVGLGLSICRLRLTPYDGYGDTFGSREIGTALKAQEKGVKIIGSVWTPDPKYKKQSTINNLGQGSPFNWDETGAPLNGGQFDATTQNLNDYADDLVTTLQALSAAGVEMYAISPANEPNFEADYDSCRWTEEDLATFYPILRSAMNSAGFNDVLIYAPETVGWKQYDDNSLTLQNTDIDILSFHDYVAGADRTPIDRGGAPQRVWKTEGGELGCPDCSGSGSGEGFEWSDTIDDALWVAKNIWESQDLMEQNAWLFWWLRPNGTPGGNATLVADNTTENPRVFKRAYAIAQYSKFIRPEAQVLAISSNTYIGDIFWTAYKNIDDSVVIVAINEENLIVNFEIDVSSIVTTASVKRYITDETRDLHRLSNKAISSGVLIENMEPKSIMTFVLEGVI